MSRLSGDLGCLDVGIEPAPKDAILGKNLTFKADSDPRKVNLGVGAYKTDDLESFVPEAVRVAEQQMIDEGVMKDYLPQDGYAPFLEASRRFMFGEDCPLLETGQISSLQSISGTGALMLAARFVREYIPFTDTIHISDPTWGNHAKVFGFAGLSVEKYPYLNAETLSVDIEAMKVHLEGIPDCSIVLFHGCCHNPTGVDPDPSQWDEICQIVLRKNLLPFFDVAYLGFGSGDPTTDAYSFRSFIKAGVTNMIVAQSYAKNMGLYGERIGALHFVCPNAEIAENIRTQMKTVIRRIYSNPPQHGAHIVHRVLSNPDLTALWRRDLTVMADRLRRMRKLLHDALVEIGAPGKWDHIVHQIGMFSYTGLTSDQVDRMEAVHHIYMLNSGRISMTGLNEKNVHYVAEAMKDCIENVDS